MRHTLRRLLASCWLLVGAGAVPASASIVINVGGAADDAAVLTHNEALVAVFQLNQAFNNLSISIPVTCAACDAVAYLTTDFGPGASLSTFNDSADVTESGSLFSNLSLAAGTYALVVWNNSSDVLLWGGSATPSIQDPGGSLDGYFLTTNAGAYPPDAFYTPFHDLSPFYSITTDAIASPEPASLALVALILSAVPIARRRRNRRLP
jgi:hypothetical protein